MSGVKDLTKDLIPRFASLLDPQIWQSPESIKAGLVGIATGFVGSRIGGILKNISASKEKINEEVLESEKTKRTILDLAKFAAQENPDIEVWEAVKKIFIQTLQNDLKEQERAALYDLIDICKHLSGSEIQILAGAYQIKASDNPRYINRWGIDVAAKIGRSTPEEILRYEDNLINQRLICPPEVLNGTNQSTWLPSTGSGSNRLTNLGQKLAQLLISDK